MQQACTRGQGCERGTHGHSILKSPTTALAGGENLESNASGAPGCRAVKGLSAWVTFPIFLFTDEDLKSHCQHLCHGSLPSQCALANVTGPKGPISGLSIEMGPNIPSLFKLVGFEPYFSCKQTHASLPLGVRGLLRCMPF